jgi:hypothetical protein
MSHSSTPKSASTQTPSKVDEGKLSPAQLARSLGITCQKTEVYAVGGYRYTNLTDAIAQARRMTRLESELL